jgi:hypothetical protein
MSWTALQEEDPGQVLVALSGGDSLAREDGDLLTARLGVVERHAELVVGEEQARQAVGRASHDRTLSRGGVDMVLS